MDDQPIRDQINRKVSNGTQERSHSSIPTAHNTCVDMEQRRELFDEDLQSSFYSKKLF